VVSLLLLNTSRIKPPKAMPLIAGAKLICASPFPYAVTTSTPSTSATA
jgi:hypothetical protein